MPPWVAVKRPDAFPASRDYAAIQYTTRPVDARVINAGKFHLDFDRTSGYLPSLPAALDVPTESQTLVYSETSAQAALINPRSPLAVFFKDTVWGRMGSGAERVEVAAHDFR